MRDKFDFFAWSFLQPEVIVYGGNILHADNYQSFL